MRYVCCLCSKIPMRCHWCCCFRYIRISSLFFSFGSFGLNLYIILYILRSLWVQEHTNVVSLCLFLNFVRQVVCSFVLFMCFHSFLLTCQTVEGKRRLFTALWGFGVWGGRFLWFALLTFPQSSLFYFEGWQQDTWENTRDERTKPSHSSAFSCPQRAVSSWLLVLIRCPSKKSKYP